MRTAQSYIFSLLCLTLALLALGGCGTDETAGDVCAEQLTQLAQTCPAGTAASLRAAGEGSCQGEGSANFVTESGELAGSCVKSGSCDFVCRIVIDCPCGASRITRDEVICRDNCNDDENNENNDENNDDNNDVNNAGPNCPEDNECDGRQCGPDPICGISCGSCGDDATCNDDGQCQPIAEGCPDLRDCSGRVCGPDPVCGTSCGTCGDDASCQQGACQPNPLMCPDTANCNGRQCGPDPVCGTSCGTCNNGQSCNNGTCVNNGPTCPQDADCGGRECGPDPVCGTSCGTCNNGTCNGQGACESNFEAGLTECIDVDGNNPDHDSCQTYCQSRGQSCYNCVEDPIFGDPRGVMIFVTDATCQSIDPDNHVTTNCTTAPLDDIASIVRCCCR